MLGGDPQDLKFKGEHTTVEIGDGTTIREYTTINRGTTQSFKTTVGKNCFLMSYVHLAHDCHVGDGVIISNGTQLAGHVTIDDKAIIVGAASRSHQFVTIGQYSFIGGCSRVAKDVPPYVKAVGNPIKLYGLNSVGLAAQRTSRRRCVRELKRAYRLFFKSELNLTQATERAAAELQPFPEVQEFLAFVERERSRSRRLMRAVRIGVIGAGASRLSSHAHSARPARARTFAGLLRLATRARARQVAAELGVQGASDRSTRCSTTCDAVTIVVPTPAHFAVAAPALERGHARADREADRDDARGGGRAARDRARAPARWCRPGTSSDSTAPSAPRCRTSTRRGSSRAIGSRRSIRAARTSPSCST